MLRILERTVRNEDATSEWFDTDAQSMDEIAFFIRIFAAPGGLSPTLRMIVEESPDKDTFVQLGQTAQLSTATSDRLRFTNFARYVRVRLEIGGTSATFDCAVTADTD